MKTWNLSLEELEARIAPDTIADPTILRDPGADGTGPTKSDDSPTQGTGGSGPQGEAKGHPEDEFDLM
jgi:hypothetical protein